MSIQQAYQLSLGGAQFRRGALNAALGSTQILRGEHLVPALRRERADLLARESSQLPLCGPSHTFPLALAIVRSQIARFIAALVG